jgi:tetratricopeptide (TPR) repeat protein
LMLAWHCYRAGRALEAEPFLLRGSREAMNRGASFETELALRSALGNLTVGSQPRARLLLCEALQEQSRWSESLEGLGGQKAWPHHLELASTSLELHARAATTVVLSECNALLGQTLALIEPSDDVEERVPAVLAAARITNLLGATPMAEEVLRRATAMAHAARDLNSRMSLTHSILTIAWKTRQLRKYGEFWRSLRDLSLECDRCGVENASRFTLENVRGCLETTLGNYSEALSAYRKAYSIAKRIGDDERTSISAGNIAMCLGRTGCYGEQRCWAEKALEIAPTDMQHWRLDRARFHLAWGYAMSGNTRSALAGIDFPIYNLDGSPQWVLQGYGLLRADILQLCGEYDTAAKEAREVLNHTSCEPLAGAYAGTVARWVAVNCREGIAESGGRKVLNTLLDELEDLDLVDQAEVLAAVTWLEEARGEGDLANRGRLLDTLKRLPDAVAHQLRRLGVLGT